MFSGGDDLDSRLAVLIGRVDDFTLPNAVVLLELLVYLGFPLGGQGGLLDEVDLNE